MKDQDPKDHIIIDPTMDRARATLEDRSLPALSECVADLSDTQLERAWMASTALAAHYAVIADTFGRELRGRHVAQQQGAGRA